MTEVHRFQPLHYLEENEDKIGLVVLNQQLRLPHTIVHRLWHKAVIRGVADGAINTLHGFLESNADWPLPLYVSGDFDSAKPELLDHYRSKGVSILPTPDQDRTDFEKCLDIMLKEAERSPIDCIVVLAGLGGRFDHEMANINSLWKIESNIPVHVHNHESVALSLTEGRNEVVVTSPFRGEWCGLIPFTRAVVTTRGLKWNLTEQVTEFGGLVSTSNKVVEDTVHVETDAKIIWTMGVDFRES